MTSVKERQKVATRTRVRRVTAELLITDFDFNPPAEIHSILATLPGVEDASVDPLTGQATVTYRSEDVSLSRIVEVIGETGFFTVVGSVSSPSGR